MDPLWDEWDAIIEDSLARAVDASKGGSLLGLGTYARQLSEVADLAMDLQARLKLRQVVGHDLHIITKVGVHLELEFCLDRRQELL